MRKKSTQMAMKITKTSIGILLCIALLPLLIANITIIVNSYVNPDKIAAFFGYKPFIVLSDSMNPNLSSGDLVLVRETAPDSLRTGDIIAFRVGDSVITHRIVGTTVEDGEIQYITRGDANNTEDAKPVSAQMVEGSYYANIPGLGNVVLFMQTPAGMLVCIGLPVILLVAYDILRRRRYDQEKRKATIELERELERMRGQIQTTDLNESISMKKTHA